MLSGLRYGPLFDAMSMADNGYKEEDLKRDFSPALAYDRSFVLGLLSAALFAVVVGPRASLGYAFSLSVAIGVSWVSAAIGTDCLFERRPPRLFLINAGYPTLRFALIGLVFELIG